MAALAIVCFAMRMTSKTLGSQWGSDDSLIMASFVFTISFVIILQISESWPLRTAAFAPNPSSYSVIPQGLGLNIWVLTDDQITTFQKCLVVAEFDYVFTLSLIKASILLFFLRIFAFSGKRFRIVVWLTMVYNFLSCLLFLIMGTLQRRPLRLLWDGWKDEEPRGEMLDVNALAFSHAGINVALDVWMLVLPLIQLYQLGLKTRKKIEVIAMFSVGVFLTIVSVIRIPSLLDFAVSSNATAADSQGFLNWSCIELCVGIMVACMPHARQLVRIGVARWMPNKMDNGGSSADGIFPDRSLGTIWTAADASCAGSTAVRGTTMELQDKGGLLGPSGSVPVANSG
ncbi:hypothetical protein ACJZ2D_001357 [Fusarium nematophilum]